MSSNKKPAKRLYTLATAIGLALGTMGIAAAASPSTVTGQAPNQVEAPSVASDGQSDELGEEIEESSDEDTDGIDHQFEGQEIGNNGDGIADADDAAEIEESSDEDTDGIDHQFEGEEIGNNGDGIADADDAAEVADTP